MVKKSLFLAAIATLLVSMFLTPVMAKRANHPNNGNVQDQVVTQEQLTCAVTAVDKREVAVQVSLDTYYNTVKTALTTRQAALKVAWAILDSSARKDAVKAAWSVYKKASKDANKKLNVDRRATWSQFKTDMKVCNMPPAGEPKNE